MVNGQRNLKLTSISTDRPFMLQGQLTPVSRSASPTTPVLEWPSPDWTDECFSPHDELEVEASKSPPPSKTWKIGGMRLFGGSKDKATTGSKGTNGLGAQKPSQDGGAIAPLKLRRKKGYAGFGPPPNRAAGSNPGSPGLVSRSETFPKPSPSGDSPRRLLSEPGTCHNRSRYRREGAGMERERSIGPDRSRRPPPRTSILTQHKLKNPGSVDLAAEFGAGNPYHTPQLSTVPALPSYGGPGQARREGFEMGHWHKGEREKSSTAAGGIGKFPGPEGARRVGVAGSATMTATTVSSGTREGGRWPLVESAGGETGLEESAMEPRRGREAGRAEGRGLRDGRWQTRTAVAPSRKGEVRPQAGEGGEARGLSSSRGDCRACGLAIRGKSISSADGRLTGRYHKACFVCTACSEPFASREVYVLRDAPYCEQHYHRLNGSLCGACGWGIEGQYLEDESRRKYHPGCFLCLDCGISLSDGYFDVDGEAFCERDAWRRLQMTAAAAAPPPEMDWYQYRYRHPAEAAAAGMGGLGGPGTGEGFVGLAAGPGPPPGWPGGFGQAAAMAAGPRGRFGGWESDPYCYGPFVGQAWPGMNRRMTRLGNI